MFGELAEFVTYERRFQGSKRNIGGAAMIFILMRLFCTDGNRRVIVEPLTLLGDTRSFTYDGWEETEGVC